MQSTKYLIFLIIFCLFLISCTKKEVELKGDVFIVTQGAENYKMGLVKVIAFPEETIKQYIESKKSDDESKALIEYEKAQKELEAVEKTALELETSYRNKLNSIKNSANAYGRSISEIRQNLADIENWDESSLTDAKLRAVKAKFKLNEASDRLKSVSSAQRYFINLPDGLASSTSDADGEFILKLPKIGKYALAAQAERKVGDKTEKYYWLVLVNADKESKSIMLSNNNLTDSVSADSLIKTIKYE